MSGGMRSAGLLPFRLDRDLEVLVAHPGGPYFAHKDKGSWSLVKGLVKRGESDEQAAIREFREETGWEVPSVPWVSLGETRLRSGKMVIAWALGSDFELADFDPGTFVLHGRRYPEIDRVAWLDPMTARSKLSPAQGVFVDRLEIHLGLNGPRKE